MYTSIGLLFLSGAGLIIYKGFKEESWSRLERLFFYVCVTLAISYFTTGYQYLLFGEWGYEDFLPYLIVRSILNGLLLLMFVRFIQFIWKKMDF